MAGLRPGQPGRALAGLGKQQKVLGGSRTETSSSHGNCHLEQVPSPQGQMAQQGQGEVN